MGGHNGFLSLVSVPEIKSITDLKGKTVSVDALTTGYAFVLLDLLKRAGLNQADYKIEKAGGVVARWEALKDKKHDATLLITPFDIFARKAGLNVLQYAISVYGHYQGLCGATRREWAASNPRLVEAYIRGYVAGVDFLRDARNKDCACAVLRKHLPQMSDEIAAQTYAAMTGATGFTPKAELEVDGVRRVLTLRSEFGHPKKEMTDPTKYYLPDFYRTAINSPLSTL
jgi:ABC-type nitrate/sulfonate/bicarbonate transport system substrate-binding protein